MNRRTLLLGGTTLLAAAPLLLTTPLLAQEVTEATSAPGGGTQAPPSDPPAPRDQREVAGTGVHTSPNAAPTKSPKDPLRGVCPYCGAPLPQVLSQDGAPVCTAHSCHG